MFYYFKLKNNEINEGLNGGGVLHDLKAQTENLNDELRKGNKFQNFYQAYRNVFALRVKKKRKVKLLSNRQTGMKGYKRINITIIIASHAK